jgi:Cu-Zn family superoxide dismutase
VTGCILASAAAVVGTSCGDDETGTTTTTTTTSTTAASTTAATTGTGGAGGAGGAGTGGAGGEGQGGGGGGSASSAEAMIEAKSGSNVSGTATFTSDGKMVTLVVTVKGVEMPGEHGVHIHEMGNCMSPDAMSAGAHWNPTMKDHGKWGVDPFHLGDIGNMMVDAQGNGTITLTTDLWTIGGGGQNDVVGKAILVHDMADDFMTQPAGGAGARIGCGVIALTK